MSDNKTQSTDTAPTQATPTTNMESPQQAASPSSVASPVSPSTSSVPPGFPRLGELSAALTSSTTSIGSETSEAAREEYALHFLSMGGKPLSPLASLCMSPVSAAKRKKKKAAWTEKYENTAVVIGPVETHELFKELVGLVKEQCGEVKSHYYREEQHCGFVYFHSDQVADNCKEHFDGYVFDGTTIRAKSPSNFFANQEDAFPEHDTSHRPSHPMSPPVSPRDPGSPPSPAPLAPASIEPTPTLVIKNLCFGLKQEKLLEFMAMLKSPPQSVSYHYDNNGLFRGVAFAKYTTAEQAAESLAELDGKEIGGRKLRVEFKRRTSAQNPAATTPSTPTSPPPAKAVTPAAQPPLTPTSLHPTPQPLAATPTTPAGPALPMSHVLQTASASVAPRPLLSTMSNGQPIIRPAGDFGSLGHGAAPPRPTLISGGGSSSVPVSLFRTAPQQPPVPQMRPAQQQDLRQRTAEPVSLFRTHQSFGGIVIREGLEFEHIPSEPSRSQYPAVPPPMSSFKAASMMPVLRAGMEFA